MMNMKSSGIRLLTPTNLTSEIVSLAYLVAERRGKFFWIPNIKALASRVGFDWNTVFTVDSIVSAHYQTDGFCNQIATTKTRDLNGIVMSVVLSPSSTMNRGPLALAFMRTKKVLYAVYVPLWTLEYFSAMFTGNYTSFIWLKFRPVRRKIFSFSSALIIFLKNSLTTTSTFDQFIRSIHKAILPDSINISKTSLAAWWR